MAGGNGHSGNGHNGHGGNGKHKDAAGDFYQPAEDGEGGPAESVDLHRPRMSLAVIQQAVRNGWAIPQAWRDNLPVVAAQIAGDPEAPKRDRLRALEVLKAFDQQRLDAAVALDKIERLDGGEATERTEFMPVHIRRVSRISDVD